MLSSRLIIAPVLWIKVEAGRRLLPEGQEGAMEIEQALQLPLDGGLEVPVLHGDDKKAGAALVIVFCPASSLSDFMKEAPASPPLDFFRGDWLTPNLALDKSLQRVSIRQWLPMINIRIFVIDDDALARKALVAMLATKNGFKVVAEAEDEDTAIEKYAQFLPDITLLGVRPPCLKGFNTLHQLRYRHPDAKIIMLSCSRLPQDVVHARQLGACGCVPKQLGRLTLCSAIERVSLGYQVWDIIDGTAAPVPVLSSREIHVLECARKGFCNGDIGLALSISEHTVKSHIKNVLRKLHAANRAEAVARGYELNLFKDAIMEKNQPVPMGWQRHLP